MKRAILVLACVGAVLAVHAVHPGKRPEFRMAGQTLNQAAALRP